ncbi:MAG: HAD-IIIA family hydrolase [Cyanobacteria bacterium P01_E01_bin.42]
MAKLSAKLNREIAGAANSPDRWLFDFAPIEDQLLYNPQGNFGTLGVDEYDTIARDLHIGGALHSLYWDIIQAEWQVIPASNDPRDIKASDRVKDQLLNVKGSGGKKLGGLFRTVNGWRDKEGRSPISKETIEQRCNSQKANFDEACLAWLTAILKGYKPNELFWEREGNEDRVAEFRPRPSRRFLFETVTEKTPRNAQLHKGFAIKVLTRDRPVYGEFITALNRILIHTVNIGSMESSPYGYGLGSSLWFPFQIKREVLKLWLIGLGKSVGGLRAILPQGTTKASELWRDTEQLLKQRDPENYYIHTSEIDLGLLELAKEMHPIEFLKYIDAQCSVYILGETGTVNQSEEGGSRAEDEVAERGLGRRKKGYADILSITCNVVARWITELNDPDANPPTIWRDFDSENLGQKATTEKTLVDAVGKPLDRNYAEETYGVKFSDEELPPQSPQKEEGEGIVAEFGQAQNYFTWNGFRIGIEYNIGSERFGRPMKIAYGYFVNHVGADGEALDVYIGPHLSSDRIFRIAQTKWDDPQQFDEYKYAICFDTIAQAERAYKRQMTSRPFGGIEEVSLDDIISCAKATNFASPPTQQMRDDMQKRRENWQAIADAPYVRWKHNNHTTPRPREGHLALDGKIFPNDRDYWAIAMPPNAYHCQCSLEPVYELAQGETVSDLPPIEKICEYWKYGPDGREWFALFSAPQILDSLTPEEFEERYQLVIFDADGTLRRCTIPGQPCPHAEDEWEIIPEAKAWCDRVNWNEKSFALASNQAGIEGGHLSEATARRLLRNLAMKFFGRLPLPGMLQFCPSADAKHRDRKPNPGMLHKIMSAHKIYYDVELRESPVRVLMVGDMHGDRDAAEAAGVDFIWAQDLFGLKGIEIPKEKRWDA